jgi:photosystem II stability/assembly factor-like uncharacterized protein
MTENIASENPQTNLVYALACTPDMQLCLSAQGSGLYRSVDSGESWQPAYASLDFTEPMPTTSVVLSPEMDIESTVIAGVPGGLLLSSDAGVTWQPTTLTSPPPMVSTMTISPNYIQDGVIFLGTAEDGVFRSANRGTNWSRWNFGLLDLTAYCFGISPNYARDETLYVGVESGVFCSTNGGRAWREVDLPIGYEPVLCLALSPTFGDDRVIFAGTETKGLLQSTDGGLTWIRLVPDEISFSVNSILLSPNYPHEQDILVLHENGLVLSRNNGTSWEPVETEYDDITAVIAPQGLQPGKMILMGLFDGTVHKMMI